MDFKQYLDTLRLSSKDAIVDGEQDSLSDLKKYLHIERDVERDLCGLILNAAASEGPQFIFLMGNVGDGKSHLLAKMWELYPEEMSKFRVFNDATESTSTKITYLENLAEVFKPYADDNLVNPQVVVKTIIAINLGTLTNFLEESTGLFERMRKYISDNGLIERKIGYEKATVDTVFHALNLADYHIFSVTSSGPKCEVLSDIIQKITNKNNDNPFFLAYLSYYESHPKPEQCPIKNNFDFLSEAVVQQSLSEVLVKVILSDKLIVSVRLMMNLIYDLIVSPELSSLSLEEITERTSSTSFVSEFYRHTITCLLFESGSTSFILKSIQTYDPVSTNNEQLEMLMIKIGTSTLPSEYFNKHRLLQTDGFTYRLIPLLDIRQKLQLFLRLHYLLRTDDQLATSDLYFNDFLKNLYWFNSGELKSLLPFYNQVQQAIYLWNGTAGAGNDYINLNIGRKQSIYKVSQKLQLTPVPVILGKSEDGSLQKFTDFLLAGFKISSYDEKFQLEIDYNLYRLIRQINEGYRPNRIDKGIHLKFSQFVDKLIKYQSQLKELVIQEFTGEIHKKFKLQFTEGFDYFQFITTE